MNNTIEKGYTVIYDTSNDKIGFIGIDDHSGGYPYFASMPDSRNITKTIGPAFSLKRSVLNSMKTFYGADKVHFGTVRVVKMSTVFEEIDEVEENVFLQETLKKLNQDEIDVIERHLTSGGKS